MHLTAKQMTWLKVCLHLVGLLPFLWLVWAVNHGGLGVDLVKDIQHFTGRTTLKFLLAILLVTLLARYAKQPLLMRTRRLLGLWCFTRATLHLTSYASLEPGVNNLALLDKELITRPYLTLGITSWVILLALAFTSTQAMQRKLDKHWQQSYNFVYLVAILAPIHYLWSMKIISPQPLIYAGLAVLLLALRYKKLRSLFNRLRKQVHSKLSVQLHIADKVHVIPAGCGASALSDVHRSHQVMLRLSSTSNHQDNLFYFNKIDKQN